MWKTLVLIVVAAAMVQAQDKPAQTGDSDYSKEAAIVERMLVRVTYQADGTATRETTSVFKVQSDAGVQQFGLLKFLYAKFNENVEVVYVRVRKPDGTVITTPAENVQDMPAEITRQAPFYSDLRELHVAVRGLRPGDTLEFQVRSQLTHPQVAGQFWFSYDFVRDGIAKDEELEINIPQDKYVKVKSPNVKPTMREEGHRRIYFWKTANLKREQRTRGVDRVSEQMRGEAPAPSVELTSFRDWEEIGRWYSDLQRQQILVTPEIQSKALEITKGLNSEQEKAEAIYSYAATGFRYIGLAFGAGRYQPHAASDVLANEYGDCKDKHTLLAALLKAVGIQAWPALINSRRKIDPELPSPGQFDHMITVVQLGKDLVWLDTTSEVAPFGMLMSNLRDKEALVIFENKPPALLKTPANPVFPTASSFVANTRLASDGTLTGRIERSERGDLEVILRAAFRKTARTQWEELAQQISFQSGFQGKVSNVEISTPEATKEPFRLAYDYTRKEYSDWKNHRILAPLPPMQAALRREIEDKPQKPIYLGAPGEAVFKSRLQLPEGYSLTAPAKVELKNDFAEYQASYRLENGVFSAERRLVIKQREFMPSQWEEFRRFNKAVTDDHRLLVDLHTSGEFSPGIGATGSTGTSAPAPEATRLLEKARDAVSARNLAGARDYLEQLVKLDPKYPDAWAALAVVAAMQNRTDEAIQDFRKELEYHPENTKAYRALAQYLSGLRRWPEAIEALKRLAKLAPEDVAARNSLAIMLISQNRYAEAIEELTTGMPQGQKNPEGQALLGTAYLKNGQTELGINLLKKTAEGDPTHNTLNSAGYALADAHVELPLAKQYAIKAVEEIEKLTADISLPALKPADLQRMNLLSAYWDTLGWVYFQTNELEQAEKYLRAAWTLSQDAEEGDHLGQLYEKQGKWQEAAHAYRLALANPKGDHPEILEHYKRAQQKAGPSPEEQAIVDAVKKGGPGKVMTFRVDPGEELSRMRRVQLGAAKGRSGSAEFLVLLSKGPKVEDVRFLKGSAELTELEPVLRKARFDQPFPDDGPTKIVRRGILMCTPKATCDFVVVPPDVVVSMQ